MEQNRDGGVLTGSGRWRRRRTEQLLDGDADDAVLRVGDRTATELHDGEDREAHRRDAGRLRAT
jgi:hypothetical protein